MKTYLRFEVPNDTFDHYEASDMPAGEVMDPIVIESGYAVLTYQTLRVGPHGDCVAFFIPEIGRWCVNTVPKDSPHHKAFAELEGRTCTDVTIWTSD